MCPLAQTAKLARVSTCRNSSILRGSAFPDVPPLIVAYEYLTPSGYEALQGDTTTLPLEGDCWLVALNIFVTFSIASV